MRNRTSLLSLAALCAASGLYAQSRPSLVTCSVSAGVPPVVRAEGVAELIGDLVIQCTGGTPTPKGQAIPSVTLELNLNTNITSRQLTESGVESLLLVDDPAANRQFPCTEAVCEGTGAAPLGAARGENRNVFQAFRTGASSVAWRGVPLDPPGSGIRTLRIRNVRVNASQIGTGSVALPTAVMALVRLTGSSVRLDASPVTVAHLARGGVFTVADAQGRVSNAPLPLPLRSDVNMPIGPWARLQLALIAREGFASSFKPRNAGTSGTAPTRIIAESEPVEDFNTETGFFNPQFPAANGLNSAGLADSGTRIAARFSGIPGGVRLFVTTTQMGASTAVARLLQGEGPAFADPTLVLSSRVPVTELPVMAGSAVAVWEVLSSSPANLDTLQFGVLTAWSASRVSPGKPTVVTSFAPTDGTGTSAIPRFLRSGAEAGLFVITSDVSGPAIATASPLPSAARGVPYKAAFSARGGQTPYEWVTPSGVPPAGLNLDSESGALTGVPANSGNFDLAVLVLDEAGAADMKSFALAISDPVPPPTIPGPPPPGRLRAPYSFTFTVQGGASPFRWSAGTAPPGLTFTPTTATLAGVPSATGEFDMPLTVEDSRGQRASQVFRIVIRPARVVLLRDPPPSGVVGQVYSYILRATDGELPYSWAISAPALPAGLTLDPSSGTIRGVPQSAGTSRFSVTVQDRAGDTDSAAFAILIDPRPPEPPEITPATPPSGTVGTPYAFTFGATGGVQPYRWSIASGALPAGLNLNPASGEMRGVPTAAGPARFVLRVTDSVDGSASRDVLIDIAPQPPDPPTIPGAPPPGRVRTPYSFTFTAERGAPPFRWSAGPTPPGLTFASATATLAGVPSATGEFDMPVTVEDSRGQRASQVFRIVIQQARVSLLRDPQPPAGVVGQAYSHTLRASDGEPPYAWAISAPALPEGLTLDPTSGTIRGVPQSAGTSRFSVTVQDRTGETDSAAFAIVIEPPAQRPPQILPGNPPAGVVGVEYVFLFQATEGVQPYAWSIAAGSLPAGVRLNPASGELRGVPTTAGPARFTLRVTDSVDGSASRDVVI
jgi:hypothetical protein